MVKAADVRMSASGLRAWLGKNKRHLQNSKPYLLARFVRASVREVSAMDTRVMSLEPGGRSRGRVLLSYINDPFFLKPGEPVSNTHTHHWESREIARTFLNLDYSVDVIRYSNTSFVPTRPYAFFIDARLNLERLARRLGPDCVKIMHVDTAHWLFHNAAQYQRLLALRDRKGAALSPRKLVPPNRAIEAADCATILGNEFTIGTYRYAGKPMHRVPISTTAEFDWPETKDFEACRKRFLWFGSNGFVHKGLDLVLEAFAGMPEYHLRVCGPIAGEKEFEALYRRELYETPNIETRGWVDVEGPEFREILQTSLGAVYMSCSEGGGGSIVTCLHAGLLPVVTVETSVDVDATCGVVLRDCSVDAIRGAVRELSARPPDELRTMARRAWEFARSHHTRERFARVYREVVERLLAERDGARRGIRTWVAAR